MTAKDRRKKFRIVHKLQLKYTLSLLVPFFIILIIVELQMFYIIKWLLPAREFVETQNIIVSSIVLTMLEVLILLILAGMINIIYLHRIAGPINRIIKELNEMEKTGNYHLLSVRKDDEIQPMITEFNKILAKFIQQK